MINNDLVKIIEDWHKTVKVTPLFPRDLLRTIDTKTQEVVDIIGPRRSGKSFIFKLLILQIRDKGTWLYINFEDPYFVTHNDPQIIEQIIEVYKEYFSPSLTCLFFDEIQNIRNWETVIRKLRDTALYKIYITGSSSKLLSGELATVLSGRHLSYPLLPLSFREFLSFRNVHIVHKKDVLTKKQTLVRLFDEYLEYGGFPQVVLEKKHELLKQYYSDIVEKDIIKRHDVRQKTILEQMGLFLLSNSAKTISIESLKKTYDISYELASDYLEYFKEAFLVFELPQFSYSLKRQQKAYKKIFSVDTGLAGATSFRFSEDKGRMLENLVFLHLKRTFEAIYYYKTARGKECDFLVKQGRGPLIPIQVSWSINEEKTKRRELDALFETMDELKLSTGLLLTHDDSPDTITQGSKTIHQLPVYSWALD